ncbi:MAG: transcriptional regulator [Cyanobacteriota bacterium]|nr:transcriptional regulator [Cyanobacteriota bacterium]
MKDLTIPITRSYQKYLIESLKTSPEEAAAYMVGVFEEKNPEPELVPMVLKDLIEAFGQSNSQEKLDELLSRCGTGTEIYAFVEALKVLGFGLEIKVESDVNQKY